MKLLEGNQKSTLRFMKPFGAGVFGIFSIIGIFIAQVLPANADIPNYINYQARLRDNSGNAITASTSIQFTIYNNVSSGSPSDSASASGPLLWKEVRNQASGACAQIKPDSDGYFALNLGSCVSLPSYLDFASGTYYLAVKIGSDAEASPRVLLATHPYAFNSHRVDGLHATTTATANQLLALGDDLSFNIGTGTYSGDNISLTSSTATSTFGGNLSVTGNATFATATISNLIISGATNFNNLTWNTATGTDLNITNNLTVLGDSYFGTIASGTWQGSIIQPEYGGTGQDTSGWTGFAYLSGGVWSSTNTISAGSLPSDVMFEGDDISLLNNNVGYITSSALSSYLTLVSTTVRLAGDGTDSSPLDLAQQGASVGEVLKWNGTSWAPNTDIVGSSSTSYTAGDGLNLIGTEFSIRINSSFTTSSGILSLATTSISQWTNDVGYVTSGYAFLPSGSAGQILVNTGGTSWTPTSSLFVAGDGFVGIGLTMPENALHVNGGISLSDATPSTTNQALYNSGGDLYWDGSLVTLGGDVDLDIAYHNGNSIVADSGPITISGMAGINGAISVTNASSTGEIIYVNNIAAGNGVSVRNISSGSAFTTRNQGSGNGLRIDNNTDTGRGIYLINDQNGIGISLSNSSGGTGFSMTNSGSGYGINLSQSGSGTGMYMRTNDGIGFQVDLNTTTQGIYVDNRNTGSGIYVLNESDGKAINVEDQGNKTAVMITKTASAGGNLLELNNYGNGRPVYIITTGTSEGVWMRNTGSGASIWIEDASSDATPFVLDAFGQLGIGKAAPVFPLDVIGDINATGTYRINGTDYGQYFIDGAGTIGQLWQSDGSGRGLWASTSSLGFASSSHTHTAGDLPLDIVYQGDDISILYNDAGYITSSALSGYITDGNTNWDNTYGFITSSSAENLTNKTGDISMWTNNVGYVTSGYNFANLNFSNATGTNLYLTNGLTALGNSYFGTIASGTWNGNVIGVAYGGTGTSTAPSYGQLLMGNGSGGYNLVPTSSLGFIDIDTTTSPAGTDGELQFNNSGVFGASSNLRWGNASNTLSVNGGIEIEGTGSGDYYGYPSLLNIKADDVNRWVMTFQNKNWNGIVGWYVGDGGSLSVARYNSSTIDPMVTWDQTDGSMGVGVAPSYPLDVFGDINASGTFRMLGIDYGQYFINSSGIAGQLWASDGNGRGTWSSTSSLGFASAAHTHAAGDLPANIMYEGENISLLNNNAGYITSSALSGYITDGNINWDNIYGFITSSSAENLTNKTGDISMWTNNVGYITSSALAGYITSSALSGFTISNFATNTVSQWYNDSGYITSSALSSYLTSVSSTARFSGSGANASPLDLAQQGASVGEVLKWNGISWAPDTDLLGSSSTSYTAGDGLNLIGTEFSVRVNSSFTTSSGILALATTTISQWINDAGYITSSALSGYVTDGNTNWDNTYGFITSSSAENLTNKTGDISMWTNNVGYVTSGYNFANLNFSNATGTSLYLTNGLTAIGNSYFGTIASGTWNGSVIGTAYGGTGTTTLGSAGTVAYSNGTSYAFTPVGTNGQLLQSNGSGAPAWVSTTSLGFASAAHTHAAGDLPANIMYEGENISLLNNNAGYITSSALSGYITDGNTNWDNIYGFITSSSAENITNKTGDISMWTNNVGYITSSALAGYITSSALSGFTISNFATNTVSQWYNDSGYITSSALSSYLTSVSSTVRFSGSGTNASPLDLAQQGAISGQVLKWNGSAWAPANDDGGASSTVYTAGDGLSLVGSEFRARINSTLNTSTGILGLATTSVTVGTYGTASSVPQFSVDSYGRLTAASNVAIQISTSAVSGLGTMATQNANAVTITGGTINGTSIGVSTPSIAVFTNATSTNFFATTGTFTNLVVTNPSSFGDLSWFNATGTNLNLSNGLTVNGNSYFGTIASGTWNGSVISTAYGGTGTSTLGSAGSVAFSDGTSLAYTATGTTGYLLQANGSGAPTWAPTSSLGFASSTHTHAILSNGTGIQLLSYNGSAAASIDLATTSVTAATYGTASSVPQFTVDAYGRLTAASNVAISIPSTSVTGLGTMAGQNANAVVITGGTINGTSIGATTPSTAVFTNASSTNFFATTGTFTNLVVTNFNPGNLSFSNATGTNLYLSGALRALGASYFGTIASGTWNGSVIGTAYGGTGTSTLGPAGSMAFSNGTSLAYTATGTTGYLLQANGSGTPVWVSTSSLGISASAAGSTGQIQFNNGGALAASSALYWNNTNGRLGINSSTPGTALVVNGTSTFTGDISVSSGFFQNGFASCTGTSAKVMYDATTGKFGCGTDAGVGYQSGMGNGKFASSTRVGPLPATGFETSTVSVTVTPSSTSNLYWINVAAVPVGTESQGTDSRYVIRRDSCTSTAYAVSLPKDIATKAALQTDAFAVSVVDNPATTSAVTYHLCGRLTVNLTRTVYVSSSEMVVQAIMLGADLAEVYYSNDSDMYPGSVVSIDPSLKDGVKRSGRAYDNNAMGVITTKPGLVLAEWGEGTPVMVALSGRVPVRVTASNGAINPGDYLTTSPIPGVAMKATKAGTVIGQALSSFDGEGVGNVVVFIKNTSYNGTLASSSSTASAVGRDILSQISFDAPAETASSSSIMVLDRLVSGLDITAPLVTANKIMTESIEGLNQDIKVGLGENGKLMIVNSLTATDTASTSIIFDSSGNGIFAGKIIAGELEAGKIQAVDDLSAKLDQSVNALQGNIDNLVASIAESGNALNVSLANTQKMIEELAGRVANLESNISETGTKLADLQTALSGLELQLSGSSSTAAEAATGVYDGLAANILMVNDAAVFNGTIEVKKHLTLGQDAVGQVKILAGYDSAPVAFAEPYANLPIITVTPIDYDGKWKLTDVATSGFKIQISDIQSADTIFNWHAFDASADSKMFVSDGTTAPLGLEVVYIPPVVPEEPAPEQPVTEPPAEILGDVNPETNPADETPAVEPPPAETAEPATAEQPTQPTDNPAEPPADTTVVDSGAASEPAPSASSPDGADGASSGEAAPDNGAPASDGPAV